MATPKILNTVILVGESPNSAILIPASIATGGKDVLLRTKAVPSDMLLPEYWPEPSDNEAPTGYVGEEVAASANNVTLTSGEYTVLTNVALTPGDWMITSLVTVNIGTGTTLTIYMAGCSILVDSFDSYTAFWVGSVASANAFFGFGIPARTVHIAVNRTFYLLTQCTFSGGGLTAAGLISARRMR